MSRSAVAALPATKFALPREQAAIIVRPRLLRLLNGGDRAPVDAAVGAARRGQDRAARELDRVRRRARRRGVALARPGRRRPAPVLARRARGDAARRRRATGSPPWRRIRGAGPRFSCPPLAERTGGSRGADRPRPRRLPGGRRAHPRRSRQAAEPAAARPSGWSSPRAPTRRCGSGGSASRAADGDPRARPGDDAGGDHGDARGRRRVDGRPPSCGGSGSTRRAGSGRSGSPPLSLREHPDPGAFVDDFAGDDRRDQRLPAVRGRVAHVAGRSAASCGTSVVDRAQRRPRQRAHRPALDGHPPARTSWRAAARCWPHSTAAATGTATTRCSASCLLRRLRSEACRRRSPSSTVGLPGGWPPTATTLAGLSPCRRGRGVGPGRGGSRASAGSSC